MKVTYIDHMGSDLSVVNAARVSFGKRSDLEVVTKKVRREGSEVGDLPYIEEVAEFVLKEKDKKLIQFLARGCTSGDWENIKQSLCDLDGTYDWECENMEEILNHVKNMPTHWTPFGHTAITLHIKAPIFVARQLGKHQVGMVWNEISRRYVTDDPDFFIPREFRKAAENVKQGSSGETTDWGTAGHAALCNKAVDLYKDMLEMGVCPEQARMVLPQSMYTEWYWTGNLYSFANVFIQRTDSHAQKEVQEVAHQIGDIIRPLFPVSWEALTNG